MLTGWVLRCPRRVLAAALLLGAALALCASGAQSRLSNGGYIADGTEAVRAEKLLRTRFGAGIPGLVLYARSATGATDPPVESAGRTLADRLAREPGVRRVYTYWTSGRQPQLLSRDGHAALLLADLDGDDSAWAHTAERLVPRYTGAHGPLRVSATGPAWVIAQATRLSHEELLRAELLGAPLTVLVLLFAFRSLTAALLPATVGTLSVAGTFAVLRLLTAVLPVSAFAANITTALGFGLAVDYGLFVVTRYREELGAGHGVEAAVLRTMHAVGRVIAFSAATVAVCLSGLFVFPLGFLRALALAGITVVLLAALTSVTVLPALLAVVGHRIDRFDPLARLRRTAGRGGERWQRIARAVTARPLLAAVGATVLLLALAAPFAHVRFGVADERVLPADVESHAVAARIEREFDLPWTRALAVVLPNTDVVEQQDAVEEYASRVSALPGVSRVLTGTGTYRAGHRVLGPTTASLLYIADGATWLAVDADGSPADGEQLVQELRALSAPGPHLVSGRPARVLDNRNAVLDVLPTAATIIVGCVLLLLMLFTGSVLIPLKAVLVGALSLGASFGAMVYVFQDGRLRWLVGDFTVTGELDTSLPVLMFGAAFALSVDYELFLISRIREEYRATGDHRAAIVGGVARTGRLITIAATLVAVALAPLATSGITLLKITGCGLALAVLVDATVVRGVLVPAVMRLAGAANWWAPAPLARLHRRVDPHRDRAPVPPPRSTRPVRRHVERDAT
ncbi:MMPL family transporter [Streptantibioticus rubrisoli]|uniref:MMPL family transporter n=1 Tax=Streptantibioticus rubrisoli TaxID=1387313 RepID=A0ABT1P864_9ACTN|nr:MMPL family transporter [Streptantibioticus rubrisoli]MCQ4041540.1 MMPL family transporter [Streptantibioticus rubrisoli]